ncbi:kinetochore Sim4 complex subunit FTA2-domain-containing protein [Xylariaceae sp. FL1019]|nr:kinetochore Sim4 complex subunit FTA2-domain-containing protein [Xylariaceae sp. FL1019]
MNMSGPLPPTAYGPQLGPFQEDIRSIRFQRRLNPDSSGYNASQVPHGKVFQVSIGGRTFALKVFNFFSLNEIRPFLPFTGHLLKDELVRYQRDPFYAECRAFGRLIERGRDDELAVRCHGYAFLPPEVERQIERQFGIEGWNRKEEDKGSHLRAIVKSHIRWKTLQHRRKLSAMRSILEVLNEELSIYNMDIREENYLGGRLFDFSIAITVPHISFSSALRSERQILENMSDDLACFDDMVERIKKQKEKAEKETPNWKKRTRLGTSLSRS